MDFDNLHQVLRNLYQEMMPLCGDMIGVAKGIAGLGALFYVAYRVWKALAIPATEGRFGSRGPQARGQGLVSGRRGV